MNKQEMIKDYFEDRLIQIPKEILQNEISKNKPIFSFLNEVGLIKGFDGINFYFDSDGIKKTIIKGREYLILGDDYGSKLCAELSDETIQAVYDEDDLPTRYINSSIENFLLFIMIFEQYQLSLDEDENENMKKLSALQSTFNEYDSTALNYEENWWAVIIEQIEDGLL